ncbi:acyltransferase [Pseudaeromonas sp. ZJS20]|uniref:acyltransferase n=1 Tax=Pseudaeromonas aegiceratis TaxID=3153928 RepID=UPI00390C6FD1
MGEANRHQAGVREVIFGEGVTLVEPVNLYGCQLGDGVFVGPFVEIQRHVQIGAGCRIQSHSFICEYVTLGEGCFIGHGVMFANDLFRDGRPNPDPASWGRIQLGQRVVVGSNATILAVTICDEAVIGAGSVVTRDIEQKGIYAGNPARLVRPLP